MAKPISYKEIYKLCYPMDTAKKKVLFIEYIKHYREEVRATLLDFQAYSENKLEDKVRRYAKAICGSISPAKKESLENELYCLGKTKEQLADILGKLERHRDNDFTPDDMNIVLEIIHTADSLSKLHRLLRIVCGVSVIMIIVIIILQYRGLI